MDIFYFSKWLYRPEKYVSMLNYPTGGKLVRTYRPHGLQAYAITVSRMKKLRQKYSSAENPVLCRPF